MPSPFNNSEKNPQATGAVVETVTVTNSVLVCEVCWEEVSDGIYVPGARRLTFTCSQGHDNVVRNIEI